MGHMTKLGVVLISVGLASAAAASPKTYASPQDMLDELMPAVRAGDRAAVIAVFGDEAEDLFTDDEREARRNRREFLRMYREGYRFVPQDDGHLILELGKDDWPFPIPLIKGDAGWSFDVEAGRIEMATREIGFNELNVLTLLEAYVDIQARFRQVDHDGDGVLEFAQSVISDADERDGLFWPGGDSPVGERAARASLDGYGDDTGDQPAEPYDGYYFRVLTAQGPNAPGGAMDYIVNGNMVAGHAVLAVPAEYGVSAVHTFMVSENGRILQADLGEDTLDRAEAMTSYDPGEGWTPAN